MNIFFDDIIFELQKAGGISKYWSKLIHYISLCSDIKLYNYGISNPSSKNIFIQDILRQNLIKEKNFPLFFRRYFSVIVPGRFDVFHSSYYRIPKFIDKPAKSIVTVHDFMYERFDTGLRKKVHIWQKGRAISEANAIICVSENTRKDLLNFYPNLTDKQIYVIHNGVDDDFFKIDDSQYKNIPQYPIILYVGNRIGCKNFSFVLELFSKSSFLKRHKFQLICVGGGKFSEVEKRKISELNLDTIITHLSFVNNKKLNELYNCAYALIFPSIYEGFGIPALEAQKAGCPVIFAKSSSLSEVMAYDELGFTVNNIDDAEHKIKILENTTLREKIIQLGIQFANGKSWLKTAEETIKVYKNLIND